MIEQLLAVNEGKTIEFKETTPSLGSIMKTVVAFASSAGGTIIIGVKDKPKILVGLPEILLEEEQLANAMTDSIFPHLTPDIEMQF
jgi:ATP-dependent DNA helicase RecG